MKRIDFLYYLRRLHCVVVREGGKHTIIENTTTGEVSTLPRHTEINVFLARKICRDLGVAEIQKKQ